jgi:2-methylcitrate dehydratase
MALREGRLASQAYEPQRLGDPATKHLMDKVRVTSSPEMTAAFPARAQSRLTLRGTDGSTHTWLQDHPKGNAANPLSDQELEAKFFQLYAPWGAESAARRTLDLLWSVDRLGNVGALVDALCVAAAPA